jgi:hypothetical protein
MCIILVSWIRIRIKSIGRIRYGIRVKLRIRIRITVENGDLDTHST